MESLFICSYSGSANFRFVICKSLPTLLPVALWLLPVLPADWHCRLLPDYFFFSPPDVGGLAIESRMLVSASIFFIL